MAIPIDDTGAMYIPQTGQIINDTGGGSVRNVGKKSEIKGTIDSVKPTKPTVPVFSPLNMQSDGLHKLKRMEFILRGKSYRFILNPEEYQQTEPNRVTVTQTKAGGYVDDFGGGVPIISMKGTTGFKLGGGMQTNGFTKFKQLRDLIREYYFKQAPGTMVKVEDELRFYNYTDGEYWIVTPKEFKLMRSVARPLMYSYDIQLICLRPANQPASKDGSGLKPTLPQMGGGAYKEMEL